MPASLVGGVKGAVRINEEWTSGGTEASRIREQRVSVHGAGVAGGIFVGGGMATLMDTQCA